jgi:hypothetical protein
MDIPQTSNYFLKYRKANGQIHSYRVSHPISSDGDRVTVYAYKHGVRSFKVAKIIEFHKIA